jgi:hypothetical protein
MVTAVGMRHSFVECSAHIVFPGRKILIKREKCVKILPRYIWLVGFFEKAAVCAKNGSSRCIGDINADREVGIWLGDENFAAYGELDAFWNYDKWVVALSDPT